MTWKTAYRFASSGLLTTSPGDLYQRLAGDASGAWLLSSHTILHIGEPVERAGGSLGAQPPRMLMSAEELERVALDRSGMGGPKDTRLHSRWYSKLLPSIRLRAGGRIGPEPDNLQAPFRWWNPRWQPVGTREIRDEIVLPGQVWQTNASTYGANWFDVTAWWDLAELIEGDNNVSNPNLIIESQIRDKRDTVIQQLRWHYRECAALVADLARPPADPALELSWRMRLEEHASYLEWMSGRKVVKRTPIEDLEYTE